MNFRHAPLRARNGSPRAAVDRRMLFGAPGAEIRWRKSQMYQSATISTPVSAIPTSSTTVDGTNIAFLLFWMFCDSSAFLSIVDPDGAGSTSASYVQLESVDVLFATPALP